MRDLTGIHGHLLERDTEVAELHRAIDDALAGAGRLGAIEGSAGTGKSALVAAACVYGTGRGLRVLSARGSELEREYAFGAIRQLFEPVLAAASPEERSELLAGAAAPAAWVIAPADPESRAPGRASAAFAVLNAIHWFATSLAVRTPLLVVVDDLHWVDESSVRALSFLARRVADLPIALLVALRPAEPGAPAALVDELRAQPDAITITPHALSAGAVLDVVRGRLPAADEQLCVAFHAASAGNPLYLQELLRALGGAPITSADTVLEASIPTLADRVGRRVGRVSPEAPALTAAMAVLGDGGRLAVAAALAGVSEDDAALVAHRLRRIEVLVSEDPFGFVHPLVRRSVYDGLSVTERDAAHSAAAELLLEAGAAVDAVAAHLSAVRPRGSSRVAAMLMRAAEDALSRAAPDAAIRFLRRALAEGAPEPPRSVLLFALGRAELVVRDAGTVAHLQEALELAHQPDLRGEIAVVLTELMMALGQWESGSRLIEEFTAEADGHDRQLVVELEVIRALNCVYDPRHVETFDRDRDRLEQLATGDGWAAHALTLLLACVSAFRGERVDEVVARVERGFWNGRLTAERGAGGWATAQGLAALVFIDEYDRAAEMADAVAAEGRRTAAILAVLSGPGYRGQVHSRRGDLAAAEAELRPVVGMLLDTGMAMWIASAFHMFHDAILERPGLDDVAMLAETLETEPVFLATSAGAMMLECRGRLRLARRDVDGAIADLRACAATNTALKMAPTYSAWRSALALALRPHEREEAKTLVAEELSMASTIGLPRPLGIALRAAGMLEGGERGIELLCESVAVLGTSEAQLERARSLVELGAALRRRQHRLEAREHLAAGMDLAYRCGAPRLVDRAADELRAAGGRRRRIQQSGTDALTASEARVGLLAAQGRSNTEIAQELYVSLKTVETHLSHAYAKLGLSGQGARKGLADALRA